MPEKIKKYYAPYMIKRYCDLSINQMVLADQFVPKAMGKYFIPVFDDLNELRKYYPEPIKVIILNEEV